MGKKGRKEASAGAKVDRAAQAAPADAAAADISTEDREQRFLAALQKMMGGIELTEENVRDQMAKLTPQQKQELMMEGQDLKRDLMTKKECQEERTMFFKEVNHNAEQAGMPVSKDNDFLTKKVNEFMATSNDEMPPAVLLEAVASCPYLVKAALAEARPPAELPGGGGDGQPPACASPSDLAEIETALSLLRAPGWCDGDAAAPRPPFVRRNLLLLHFHLRREQLRALTLAEATVRASVEAVQRALKLLDIFFGVCLQLGWAKVVLGITSLQGLLRQGLWDHEEDECRALMKQKLTSLGLKMPKLNIRAQAADVAPGQKVRIKVTVHRSHAHSPSEMEAFLASAADGDGNGEGGAAAAAKAEVSAEEETGGAVAGAEEGGAAAEGGGDAALAGAEGKEGWWLLLESVRGLPNAQRQGVGAADLVHNSIVGRQTLSAGLDATSMAAEVEFEAPSTAGEYKVIVHVRSSSMIGVDAKRKVAFVVSASKGKRHGHPQSVTSSGTSETSEDAHGEEARLEMQEVIDEEGAAEEEAAPAPDPAPKASPPAQQQPPAKSPPKRSWADEVEEEEEEAAGWVSVR